MQMFRYNKTLKLQFTELITDTTTRQDTHLTAVLCTDKGSIILKSKSVRIQHDRCFQ
jgi:hypothetical protein